MNEHDRKPAGHFGMVEKGPQRAELFTAEITGCDERRSRNGTRETDDGHRSTEFDERIVARRDGNAQIGQITLNERLEVVLEPPLATDPWKVQIMIARNHSDLRTTLASFEEAQSLVELTFEREIRHVTGDD